MKTLILCVDDEPTVLTSLLGQLRQTFGNQYEYEGFLSAEEALEFLDELAAEGQHTELIISDWLMPRIKGDEFLIEVNRRYPSIRSIMLSGQADPDAVERARDHANLAAFVSKPWLAEELMKQVKQALLEYEGLR
jgi:CheY-like chemotaxis protein